MEEDLISKKELLELTEISYGQLYRWKRKGLIPEDWFIRKSTFTGQETFFPKNRILARIDRIKNMKEDISLDDLADVFSPSLANVTLSAGELVQRSIVSKEVLDLYREFSGCGEPLTFHDILSAYLLNHFLVAGDIGLDEGKQVLGVLHEGLTKFKDAPGELYLGRKLGVFFCFMVSPPCAICLDLGVRLIGSMRTAAAVEELKLKLI